LKGEEIPLHCRILALADSFDAMTNDRPYRKALSKYKAVEELRKNAGTQFDPHLTEIFVRLVAGFPELAACAFERTSPAVGTVLNKDNS
jgi:HD-GYP domain-containing protein (c-di-GMP phosphodiesterase class II)